MQRSVDLSHQYKYVLVCDIADFYQRIYHHSLENALKQAAKDSALIPNIMKFIANYSNTKSYSLPVGGPAARLLSELVLNKTDRLLQSAGIDFCRFADDYHIFANDKNELYKTLIFLSEKLIVNEGLSIQKSKTRIATSAEFQATTPVLPAKQSSHDESKDDEEIEADVAPDDATQLLRLSLRFDPYSPTAEEDYEELKRQVKQFDIIGLLQKELAKSRIHASVTRKLIQTLNYLDAKQKEDALRTMINNVELLYPIFGTVLISIEKIYTDVSDEVKEEIQSNLRQMIRDDHYIMSLDVNIAYAIRILALQYSPENETALNEIFKKTNSIMIRRDIILIMAKWEQFYWLSDLRNRFRTLRAAERKAFLIASYRLTDEGQHWRNHTKAEFSPFEICTRDWAKDRVNQHQWNIPI
jgi:hypothetical protein